MFPTRPTGFRRLLTDALDLAVDFATLGEYGVMAAPTSAGSDGNEEARGGEPDAGRGARPEVAAGARVRPPYVATPRSASPALLTFAPGASRLGTSATPGRPTREPGHVPPPGAARGTRAQRGRRGTRRPAPVTPGQLCLAAD